MIYKIYTIKLLKGIIGYADSWDRAINMSKSHAKKYGNGLRMYTIEEYLTGDIDMKPCNVIQLGA